jgi:outer membrane receptor for ferric coprogen and ferric-rhodotorulic acid
MLNNKAINITEVNVRKIEGAIKNGQCRETGNIGYTRYKTKTKKNKKKKPKKPRKTICVGHHYTQTNTNNVNKTGEK